MTAPACSYCGEYKPPTLPRCPVCGGLVKLRSEDKSDKVESNTEKDTPS